MIGGRKVKLDRYGMERTAKSLEMHRLVQDAAEKLAGHVRGEGIYVGDHDGGHHDLPLPPDARSISSSRAAIFWMAMIASA